MRSLYVARPIDHAQASQEAKDIAFALGKLKDQVFSFGGAVVYDPAAAWTAGQKAEVGFEIQEVNNKAIHVSDSMLAFAPTGVKSWGVPSEIETAVQRGMNVAIVLDGPRTWAMPNHRNVQYFQTAAQHGGSGGWLEGAIQALGWLADAPAPRFTQVRGGGDKTAINFAPVDGVDPKTLNLPTRAYSDDAGLDLYASEGLWVGVGEFVDIPTALRVQLPQWAWGFLVGRSSTLRKRKLMVNPGIIDAGYRGELYIGVQNLGPKPVRVEKGERLAQFIVMGNATRRVSPVLVDELEPHPRGANGFGSSGV